MDNQKSYITRATTKVLECALSDTRVVAIQGARQTGKSTLAKKLAGDNDARYLSLDVSSIRESARANPADFVRQMPEGMLVIDEIQRAPDLLLEIKEVVDNSAYPGHFLITGSSDLSKLSEVQESLAGRLERIELMPFSQEELLGGSSTFLIDAFTADYVPKANTATLSRTDYLELALCGGYPEARQRATKQRRDVWFDNYLRLLFEQESDDAKYSGNTEDVMQFLRYLATISGKEVVINNISNDTGIKHYGVQQLIEMLEKLFLIRTVPAWSTNLTNRTIKHPKVFLKDPGLLARLLHADSTTTTDLSSPLAGMLFETFVFDELIRMASALDIQPDFYHYRDARKREVDIVIENDRGKILLVEVKASSTVANSDFATIRYLMEKHGDKIARGLVVYTGTEVLPFGKQLLALPAQLLWQK